MSAKDRWPLGRRVEGTVGFTSFLSLRDREGTASVAQHLESVPGRAGPRLTDRAMEAQITAQDAGVQSPWRRLLDTWP